MTHAHLTLPSYRSGSPAPRRNHTALHVLPLAEQRPPSAQETRALVRILRHLAHDAARHSPELIIPPSRDLRDLFAAHCTTIAPKDWRLTLRWTLTHLAKLTAPLKQYDMMPRHNTASLTSQSLHHFALGVLAHLDKITPHQPKLMHA